MIMNGMMHIKRMSLIVFLLAVMLSSSIVTAMAADPVEYVDPYIGSIGILLRATTPTVQLPQSMVRIHPVTTPGIKDVYLADKIYGFPAGGSLITAITGKVSADPSKTASTFDHAFEAATPYYYSVLLEDYDVQAECTVTAHSALYRFSFPEGENGSVVFHLSKDAKITIEGPSTVSGSEIVDGIRMYFHAVFSRDFVTSGTWGEGGAISGVKTASGDRIGGFVGFAPEKDTRIEVRIGVSFIDATQAADNLSKELAGRDFDDVMDNARTLWNEELGRIRVEGGTDRQKKIFYTALYRALGRMVNITEYGRYFSGFDGRVHDADGSDFYTDDWLWDTYRCMHPLQLLLDQGRQTDIIRSYVRMYEQSGWLPLFPGFGGDRPVMIGHHATAMIVDSYMKGLRDFDIDKAYEAMKKNAMEATMLPWSVGPMTELDRVYLEKGFFPALPYEGKEWVKEVHSFERRQAVAVTLEHCYDDWCLAQMAKALGKNDDYTYFMKRAKNYTNVYNPATGFMSPRTADGKWVEPFDPKLSGGQGGRDYFAECNSWVYTWHVQHDVAGLIGLMGGRSTFIERLDRLFVEQPSIAHFHFLGQFPDATGLVGLYPQGDEPSFHIPYLYNYAGAPWRTQRRIRQVMDVWYDDDPLGIPGDEDGGAMSSWYVFAAMGFYPVCPGRPVYDIGSPVFEKITISPKNGKTITISAPGASDQNKYIQSATINGKPLNTPWFSHADIAQGGTLELVMGPRPNKTWGAKPENAPPSMSRE